MSCDCQALKPQCKLSLFFLFSLTRFCLVDRSPYNYMDLLAYITPVVGCFWYLQAKVGTLHPQLGKDVGPSQVWSMSYGILFLYLNIVSHLVFLCSLDKISVETGG
jgi:hypothetical protein